MGKSTFHSVGMPGATVVSHSTIPPADEVDIRKFALEMALGFVGGGQGQSSPVAVIVAAQKFYGFLTGLHYQPPSDGDAENPPQGS